MSAKYQAARYRVRIVGQGFGESEEKKTPFFYWKIIPIGMYDPSTPADLVECLNEERTVRRYITDNTVQYLIDDFVALGFDRAKFIEADPSMPNHFSFVDLECDARCTHEERDDKTHEKWGLSLGAGPQIEALDNKKLSNLDALYGQKLKAAIKTNGKAASKPAKRETATAAAGDEVPF